MSTPMAFSADTKPTQGKAVTVHKVKRRPVSQTPAASTQPAVQQPAAYNLPSQGPLATATVNLGSESAVAENSREPSGAQQRADRVTASKQGPSGSSH